MAKQNKQNSDFYEEQRTARDRAYYEQLNNPGYSEQTTPAYAPITPNIDQSQVGPGSATFGQSGNNLDGTNASTDLANILGNIPKALEVISEGVVMYGEGKDEELYATLQTRINEINEEEIEESVKIKKRAAVYEEQKDSFYLKTNTQNIIQVASDERQKYQPAKFSEYSERFVSDIEKVEAASFTTEELKAQALQAVLNKYNAEFLGDYKGNPTLEQEWSSLKVSAEASVTTATQLSIDAEANFAIETATDLVAKAITDKTSDPSTIRAEASKSIDTLKTFLTEYEGDPRVTLQTKREIKANIGKLEVTTRNSWVQSSSEELTFALTEIYESQLAIETNSTVSHQDVEAKAAEDLEKLDALSDNENLTASDKSKIATLKARIAKSTTLSIGNITDQSLRNAVRKIDLTLAKFDTEVHGNNGVMTDQMVADLEIELNAIEEAEGLNYDNLTDDQNNQREMIKASLLKTVNGHKQKMVADDVASSIADTAADIRSAVNELAQSNIPDQNSIDLPNILERLEKDRDRVLTSSMPEQGKVELIKQLDALRLQATNVATGRSSKITKDFSTKMSIAINKATSAPVGSGPLNEEQVVKNLVDVMTRFDKEIDGLDVNDADRNALRDGLARPSGMGRLEAAKRQWAREILDDFDLALTPDLLGEFREYLVSDPDLMNELSDNKSKAYDLFMEWAVVTKNKEGLTDFIEHDDNSPLHQGMLDYIAPKLKSLVTAASTEASEKALQLSRKAAALDVEVTWSNYKEALSDTTVAIKTPEQMMDESEELVIAVERTLVGNPNRHEQREKAAGIIHEWAQLQVIRSHNPKGLPPEDLYTQAIDWFLSGLIRNPQSVDQSSPSANRTSELMGHKEGSYERDVFLSEGTGALPEREIKALRKRITEWSVILTGKDLPSHLLRAYDDIATSTQTHGPVINMSALSRGLTAFAGGSQDFRNQSGEILREELYVVMAHDVSDSLMTMGKSFRDSIGEGLPEVTVDTLLKKVDEFFSKSFQDGSFTTEGLPKLIEDFNGEVNTLLKNASWKNNLAGPWEQLGIKTKTSNDLTTMIMQVVSSDRMALLLGLQDYVSSGMVVQDPDGTVHQAPEVDFAGYDFNGKVDELNKSYTERGVIGDGNQLVYGLGPKPTSNEILREAISVGTDWARAIPLYIIPPDRSELITNRLARSQDRIDEGASILNGLVTDANLNVALDSVDNPKTQLTRMKSVVQALLPNLNDGKTNVIAATILKARHQVRSLGRSEDLSPEEQAQVGREIERLSLVVENEVTNFVIDDSLKTSYKSIQQTDESFEEYGSTKSVVYADNILARRTGDTTGAVDGGMSLALNKILPVGDDAQSMGMLLSNVQGEIGWADLVAQADQIGYRLVEEQVNTAWGTEDQWFFKLEPVDDRINTVDSTNEGQPYFIHLSNPPKFSEGFSDKNAPFLDQMLDTLAEVRTVPGVSSDPALDVLGKIIRVVQQGGSGLLDAANLSGEYINYRHRTLTLKENGVIPGQARFPGEKLLTTDTPEYASLIKGAMDGKGNITTMFVGREGKGKGKNGGFASIGPVKYIIPEQVKPIMASLKGLGFTVDEMDIAATMLNHLFSEGATISEFARKPSNSAPLRNMITLFDRLRDPSQTFRYIPHSASLGSKYYSYAPKVESVLLNGQVYYQTLDETETDYEPQPLWSFSPYGSNNFSIIE